MGGRIHFPPLSSSSSSLASIPAAAREGGRRVMFEKCSPRSLFSSSISSSAPPSFGYRTPAREKWGRGRNVRRFHTVKYVSEYIQVFLKHFFFFIFFVARRPTVQLKLYGYTTLFLYSGSIWETREWVFCALAYLPFQEALFSLCLSTLFIFFCGRVLMEKRVHLEAGVNSQTTGEQEKWRIS